MREPPFNGIELRQETGTRRIVVEIVINDVHALKHGAFVVLAEIILLQTIDAVKKRPRLLAAPRLRLDGSELALHRLLCRARHAGLRHEKRRAKSCAHEFFQEHGSSSPLQS